MLSKQYRLIYVILAVLMCLFLSACGALSSEGSSVGEGEMPSIPQSKKVEIEDLFRFRISRTKRGLK